MSLCSPTSKSWSDYTRGYSAAHLALDYGWGNGAAVYAADSGYITADTSPGYGLRLSIDHGQTADGKRAITRYAHLASLSVAANGEWVAAGTRIGTMGSSGSFAQGVHLHFEMLLNFVKVNPLMHLTTTAGSPGIPILEEDEMKPDLWYAKVDGVPSWAWVNWASGAVFSAHNQADADYINGYMKSGNAETITGDEYKARLTMLKLLNPAAPVAIDMAMLVSTLSPQLVNALAPLLKDATDFDTDQLLSEITAALASEAAKINANIDDQPTRFVITPQ